MVIQSPKPPSSPDNAQSTRPPTAPHPGRATDARFHRYKKSEPHHSSQKNLEFLTRRRLHRRHRRGQHELIALRIIPHLNPCLLPPRARPITAPMDGLPIRNQRHGPRIRERIPRQRILQIPHRLERRIRLVSTRQANPKRKQRIIAARGHPPDERQDLGGTERLPRLDVQSQGDDVHAENFCECMGTIRSPRSPDSSTPSTAPTAPSPRRMRWHASAARAIRGNTRSYAVTLPRAESSAPIQARCARA